MFELYLSKLVWSFSYQTARDGLKDLTVDKKLIDGFMSGTVAGIKALATFLGDYSGAMIKVQVKDLTKSECSNSELKLCNEQMVDVLTQLHTEMKWRGNITATAQTKGMKKIGIRQMYTLNREETKTVTGNPFSRFLNGTVQS
tara:strand:+ start:77 stop:505 length:429 start_codon:yes stop_codon:yes gene_type:complete